MINKLKQIDLLTHISKYLGSYKTEPLGFRFHSSKDDKTASFLVYKDHSRGYRDFSGKYNGGTIIDFHMNYFNLETGEAIKQLLEMYGITNDNIREFKKAPKRFELVENFEKYRLNGTIQSLNIFLQKRGFTFELLEEFKENINEVSKEIGFSENQFVNKDIFKDIIIFPCLNEKKEIIGAKIRRCDNEKILTYNGYIKSVSIGKPKDYEGTQKFSTGLLFDEINNDEVIITEGETDYLILKILGFKSIVGNLGGASSNTLLIKKLVKNVKKIICFYDNDEAGNKGAELLEKKIGRPIRKIIFPKIDGLEKYDINDYFNQGNRKEDFEKLIKKSDFIENIKKEKDQPLYNNRFFYNDTKMEYFDIKGFIFQTSHNLSRHLYLKPKDLEDLRETKKIPTYEGICYFDGGKNGFYNLLDKSKILQPSDNYFIHEEIQFLISNICNNNQKNIDWLEKAIIYKYTHLNDVMIPAVVFHGIQGTGKGLFMKLMEQIFGKNNTQIGLTQEHLEGRFSAYAGQKLIVEYNEVGTSSTIQAKKNMNKLKNIIFADEIQIEKKGKDIVSTENIAWFFLSSNENKPIHLDSSDNGNRRFSIIKTGKFINKEKGGIIAQTIKENYNIENFLSYLFKKFPKINQEKGIIPLDNEDKKDLEFLSETVGNLFFKRIEKAYPNINKITNKERELLLEIYRDEIGENEFNDDRYKIQFFNSGLSMRYKPTVIHINGKSVRGYLINKEIKGEGYFPENFFGTPKKKIKGIL